MTCALEKKGRNIEKQTNIRRKLDESTKKIVGKKK